MDHQVQQSPVARSRIPWLVSGAFLWLVVGVAGAIAFRAKSNDASPEENVARPSLQPIRMAPADSADGAAASGNRVVATPVSESDALNAWDPKGVADFQLTERNGKTVTKADLLGKPWVVCFIFTKCAGPCLNVTHSMSRLQTALKETDVRLVSLTVDPDRDTLEVLQNYASAFDADPERWLFLTGDKKKIHDLSLKSFLMPIQEMQGKDRVPGWEVLHTTNILHVDANGVVQGKYDGKDPDEVERLIEVLTAGQPAVAEIPEGAGGTP